MHKQRGGASGIWTVRGDVLTGLAGSRASGDIIRLDLGQLVRQNELWETIHHQNNQHINQFTKNNIHGHEQSDPATILNSTLTSAGRCQSQFRRPWTSLSKKNTCNGATSFVSEAGETTGKCQGPQEPDDAKTAKKLRPGTQKEMEKLHVQPHNHKQLMEEAVKS